MYWSNVRFNILDSKGVCVGTENKLIFNPAVNPNSSREQWESVTEFYKGLGLSVKIVHVKRV